MMESGLKTAAAVSFALHTALIILTFAVIKKAPSFVMPPAYTVRIVSPQETGVRAPSRGAPPPKVEKEAAPERAVEKPSVKTVEKAPPDLECVDKNKDGKDDKTKKPCPKKPDDLTKYTSDKIAALREKKEREEKIGKLAQVKKLGEAKSAVTITAAPGGGAPGNGSIAGDYMQTVAALIQQEWILLGTGREGLYAIISVRVLKNGALKVEKIEKSSGDAVFDGSALRAIERASPVPPPPYEMMLGDGVRFMPVE